MGLIDTHAHLADKSLVCQLEEVLDRAGKAGVSQMICVAVDAGTASQAIAIAETNPMVWASAGIHPNYAHEAAPDDWAQIVEATKHPRVCALGETGLDLHWDDCPFDVQQANFERHWELSRQTDLPLIIHMRDCEPEMLAALENQAALKAPLRGVMHSFAGCTETAKTIPLDRLLVETDCPYLTPEPNRSRRPNEPAFVVHTAKCLAETIGISTQKLGEITTENAKRLFWRMLDQ